MRENKMGNRFKREEQQRPEAGAGNAATRRGKEEPRRGEKKSPCSHK